MILKVFSFLCTPSIQPRSSSPHLLSGHTMGSLTAHHHSRAFSMYLLPCPFFLGQCHCRGSSFPMWTWQELGIYTNWISWCSHSLTLPSLRLQVCFLLYLDNPTWSHLQTWQECTGEVPVQTPEVLTCHRLPGGVLSGHHRGWWRTGGQRLGVSKLPQAGSCQGRVLPGHIPPPQPGNRADWGAASGSSSPEYLTPPEAEARLGFQPKVRVQCQTWLGKPMSDTTLCE